MLDVRRIREGSGQRPGGEHYIIWLFLWLHQPLCAPHPSAPMGLPLQTPTLTVHFYFEILPKCLILTLTAHTHERAVIYNTRKHFFIKHIGAAIQSVECHWQMCVQLLDLYFRRENSFTFVNWYYKPSCPICPWTLKFGPVCHAITSVWPVWPQLWGCGVSPVHIPKFPQHRCLISALLALAQSDAGLEINHKTKSVHRSLYPGGKENSGANVDIFIVVLTGQNCTSCSSRLDINCVSVAIN